MAVVCPGCNEEGGELSGPRGNALIRDIIPDDLMKKMEAELLQAARENAEKSCRRRVLRGKGLAGQAGKSITAMVEQTNWPKKCISLLGDEKRFGSDDPPWSDSISQALFKVPASLDPEGPARPETFQMRPLSAVTNTKDFHELRNACRPALTELQQAVRYQDACSPFRIGLRHKVPTLMPLIQLTKAGLLEASLRAKSRQHAYAYQLLLDIVRFGQDLCRGRTNLLVSMVSIRVLGVMPLRVLGNLLKDPAALKTDTLRQLYGELTNLLQTQPHGIPLIQGSHLNSVLTSFLPQVNPPGWTPPGGLDSFAENDTWSRENKSLARVAVLYGHHRFKELESICSQSKWPADCTRQFKEFEEQVLSRRAGKGNPNESAEEAGRHRATAAILAEYLKPNNKEKTRERLIDMMVTGTTPEFSPYLEVAGQQLFALAFTRLQVALLLEYARTGRCPSLADFKKPPLSRSMLDPYAGKPMLIKAAGKNRYRVEPAIPLWTPNSRNANPAVPAWILHCPGRKPARAR